MAQSPETRRPTFDQVLGRLDRRIVYVGLVLVTLIPLVGKVSLPMYPTDPPKKLMQTIDELPTDKVVLIGSNWDAGTQAESRPQMIAVVRHLIRRGLKFAVFTVSSPNGPTLANTAIEQAIRAEGKEGQWNYGEHWCILGYKFADNPWIRSFASSLNAAWKQDWKGAPLSSIPMLKGVDKWGPSGQISMLIDITGTSSIESWYEFMSPTRVKIGLGCTAVMAPEQYNYLDSGQLSGLLTGMKGAAEYEQITNAVGSGTSMMAGQSFAHLYILILIILGNISILLRRQVSGAFLRSSEPAWTESVRVIAPTRRQPSSDSPVASDSAREHVPDPQLGVRPLQLSLYCVLNVFGALLLLGLVASEPGRFDSNTNALLAGGSILSLLCTVGLWRMRLWAALAHLVLLAVSVMAELSQGAPNPAFLILRVTFFFVILTSLRRMRGGL